MGTSDRSRRAADPGCCLVHLGLNYSGHKAFIIVVPRGGHSPALRAVACGGLLGLSTLVLRQRHASAAFQW